MILTGTSAIVTGGAVRIGREIGRALAQAGVNVCVHYNRSRENALAAVAEFESMGVAACAVSANLEESEFAAMNIVDFANRELGTIQILINSAAIFESGGLENTDDSSWDRHLNINLKAPFFLTQHFARQLGEESGHVVNIVDWRGERPVTGHAAYTISKAGLVAQTKLLAQELGGKVRVNGVAPGAILPAPGETQDEFLAKKSLNPLRQVGSTDDIANAVLYLLRSDFITGEILHVTGGQQL